MTASPQRRALAVLVVDDDPRVRRGLVHLLGSTPGVAVAGTAHDVDGALRQARALRVAGAADVALVDALLPTAEHGLALVRRLVPVLPVVVLSVNGAARPAALAAGASSYVEKDGDLDDLVRALQAAAG
jgi:DNA-binding NarL/FixJ family response regulator